MPALSKQPVSVWLNILIITPMDLLPNINIRGRVEFFDRPWVMGIVNVTPDSFYSGSRTPDEASAEKRIAELAEVGADCLDIGGYSTRPGADDISPEEEYRRLAVGLRAARKIAPEIPVSIDTFRASVARRCVDEWDVDIINDISGGTLDPDMWQTVADTRKAYVLMHTRGTPADMATLTDYDDVTVDVLADLAGKVNALRLLGVNDIILDPGFGFAKTVDQNFQLLAEFERFTELHLPVLAGLSRKSMLWKTLDTTPAESLNATTVVNTIALMKGASILRVHDVKAAREAVTLVDRLKDNTPLDALC